MYLFDIELFLTFRLCTELFEIEQFISMKRDLALNNLQRGYAMKKKFEKAMKKTNKLICM